jgi:ATP-dependent exoDNAse (exonuclease V) beta subunit
LEKEADPPRRVWRVTPQTGRARTPGWVVGTLVHRALQRWRFPGEPEFVDFLRPFALESGLASDSEIDDAIRQASRLLARFHEHDLFQELDRSERRHEVPYSVKIGDRTDSRILDLLARAGPADHWDLYDFKTDYVKSESELPALIAEKKYDKQVRRYVAALERLLGYHPRVTLVFLNVRGAVKLVPC